MRNSRNGGGAGFFSLLTIAFIVLKLTNVIDWSWWIVWSPLIGGFGIHLFLGLLIADKDY